MKFHIFKKFEWYGKKAIYVFTVILTCCLIWLYCKYTPENNFISFSVSIIYALLLFFLNFLVQRIDTFITSKLYEREGYFLSLRRLKAATDATIQKADFSNLDDIYNKVLMFQLFTGRDEFSQAEHAEGKQSKPYIKEYGFVYTSKMQKLEQNYINAYKNNNMKRKTKSSNKLKKYYNSCCKMLEKNYTRLMRVYGGSLQQLVDQDDELSDNNASLYDINQNMDSIMEEISSLQGSLRDVNENQDSNYKDLQEYIIQVKEQMEDIQEILDWIKTEFQ